jgi:galactokinase
VSAQATLAAQLESFERHLTRLDTALAAQGRPLFSGDAAPLLARAPGRLDVMGGIADYSGSLTLELPIAEAAFVAVQRTGSASVRLVSAGFGDDPAPLRDLSLPAAELSEACRSYADARAYFGGHAERAWAAYVAGALVALRLELGVELFDGLDIVVCSSVPEGKGVSSSAAVEVAAFQALAALAGLQPDPVELALACQRIENLVVGAPCGLMDQLTSSCGKAGQLLAILCQPAIIEGRVSIPPGLRLWGIDSGLRHQVSGADYTQVRVAAFMGYTIIARCLGLPVRPGSRSGKLEIDGGKLRGYLANVGVERFQRELVRHLPERLSGEEFLRAHAGIIDPITDVVPSVAYRVRAATAHPIHEHARATEFRDLMQRGAGADVGPRLGALMYGAHESYGACGLGSAGTDRVVELVRDAWPTQGLYGAKITGGGSGGTVAVLGASDAEPAVLGVVQKYARETGHSPQLFQGSSSGAAEFGVARLARTASGFAVEQGAAFSSSVGSRGRAASIGKGSA